MTNDMLRPREIWPNIE